MSENKDDMGQVEAEDRAGVRVLLSWIVPLVLLAAVAMVWLLLYYQQGELLGDVVKIGGGFGAGLGIGFALAQVTKGGR